MPRPIHIAYWLAHRLRLLWWRVARPTTHGVKAVVLGPDRTVLLIRHSYTRPQSWMLPGGGLQCGETAAQAATREVAEESGIAVAALRLHGRFLSTARGNRNHIQVWVGTSPGGEPRTDGREVIAAAWHPLDALPDDLSAPSRQRIIEVRDGLPPAATWA